MRNFRTRISRRYILRATPWIAMSATDMAARAASEFEPDTMDVKAVARLVRKRRVLLIDVRQADEFAVSHLAGAIRTEPDTAPGTLITVLAKRLIDVNIILYCTVGPRSMSLAINVQEDLTKAGARNVRIMRDGIIAWANADLPMVDHRGKTGFVHPSDPSIISRLIDPSRARFDVRP